MTPTRVILTTAVIVYTGLGVILAAVAIDAALCVVRPSRRCRGCRWSQTLIGRRVCAVCEQPRRCRRFSPARSV